MVGLWCHPGIRNPLLGSAQKIPTRWVRSAGSPWSPWVQPSHRDSWDHAVVLAKVLSVPEIWESFQSVAQVRRERPVDKSCGISESTDL